jgi:uncharacterized protein (TIGR02391 family)
MSYQHPRPKGTSVPPPQTRTEAPRQLASLHPVIRDAVADAWSKRDYPQAVRTGWFALRDALRDRLGEPQLDGVALVNAIGDDKPPINLPLTDYQTTSERNMHRGVVSFLRGIVYYIRNPDAHDGAAPGADDRAGALERLMVMSLCMRHIETAARPGAVNDALEELLQPRFPQSESAFLDLIEGIPVRLRGEFARALTNEAHAALAANDAKKLGLLRMFYPTLITWTTDEAVLNEATKELTALMSRDETLTVAIALLPSVLFKRLRPRHQEQIKDLMVAAAREGGYRPSITDDLMTEIPYLMDELSAQAVADIEHAVLGGLKDRDPGRQAWCTWVAYQLAARRSGARRTAFTRAIAETVCETHGEHLAEMIEDSDELDDTSLNRAIANAIRAVVKGKRRSAPVVRVLSALKRHGV